jgi:hypothetical protein
LETQHVAEQTAPHAEWLTHSAFTLRAV